MYEHCCTAITKFNGTVINMMRPVFSKRPIGYVFSRVISCPVLLLLLELCMGIPGDQPLAGSTTYRDQWLSSPLQIHKVTRESHLSATRSNILVTHDPMTKHVFIWVWEISLQLMLLLLCSQCCSQLKRCGWCRPLWHAHCCKQLGSR